MKRGARCINSCTYKALRHSTVFPNNSARLWIRCVLDKQNVCNTRANKEKRKYYLKKKQPYEEFERSIKIQTGRYDRVSKNQTIQEREREREEKNVVFKVTVKRNKYGRNSNIYSGKKGGTFCRHFPNIFSKELLRYVGLDFLFPFKRTTHFKKTIVIREKVKSFWGEQMARHSTYWIRRYTEGGLQRIASDRFLFFCVCLCVCICDP